VDSHHHLWRLRDIPREGILGASYLARDFTWEDFEFAWGGLPVSRSVFVQVRSDVEEVAFVEGVAERHHALGAMIAWAPVEREDLTTVLERLRRHPLVRGVRRNTQHEEDPDFCARPDFVAGVRRVGALGYLCEICVRHRQLPAAVALARACPDTTIVLEHLGKPDVAGPPPSYWLRGIEALGALPNVFCKVSVVVHEPTDRPYDAETLGPFVRHALEAFGWDRVLFGSNWPVSTAVVSYSGWAELLLSVLDARPADIAKLFAGNAKRLYRLN
jgi:L-fuconolactonase